MLTETCVEWIITIIGFTSIILIWVSYKIGYEEGREDEREKIEDEYDKANT